MEPTIFEPRLKFFKFGLRLYYLNISRRSAYKFLSDKVHIKSLTIGQREGVLQRGLKERSDAARKVSFFLKDFDTMGWWVVRFNSE